MLYRRLTTWLALLLLAIPTAAIAGGLQSRVQRLLQSSGLGQTRVAILVVDLDSGQQLAEIRSIEPMIPASNMKLLVSAAALQTLGPDYVFRTELRLIRPPDWRQFSGLVVADAQFSPEDGPVLVVRGDGDPAFCDPKVMRQHNMSIEQLLQTWAEAVRKAGVTRLQRLVVDDRVFDRQLAHPSWPADQMNMAYCAQVAGLNVNNNCLDIYVEPTQRDQTPHVNISPFAPFLSASNRAVTGASDTFWISRKPQTNELTYWGQVKNRRTAPFRVTMHNPPMFFAQLLAHHLGQVGISVASIHLPNPDDLLPDGEALFAVQTTLPTVLARCNKYSQNLFAEALLKRIGRRLTGSPGSWDNGAAAVRAFLNQRIGPRGAAVVIADGSGLSRHNRVTARVLVDLLQSMHEDKVLGPALRQSLSISGVDGTLGKRFRRKLAGRIYGKSGYIDGVSCLSGYLVTGGPGAGGRVQFDGTGEHTIAFSFMFNGIKPPVYLHKIKKLQHELLEMIDGELARRQPASVGQ